MRVNLLKKSEVRYQGAVSRRFIWTTSIGTVLGLALLAGVIMSMAWQSRRTTIRNLDNLMTRYEPQVKRIRELEKVLKHNKAIRDVIEAWQRNRIVWSRVTQDLQYQVPDSVQLRGLNIQVTDHDEGRQRVRMTLDALARHEQPEDVAVRFQRSLVEIGSLKSCFTSIRLVSFNRRPRAGTGPELATFSVVGTGTKAPAGDSQ